MKHYRREQGFTLIEVMTTVAIIGILAGIAYPSYRDYLIRGSIPEGTGLLANERVVTEKFLGDNRTYKGHPPGADLTDPTASVDVCKRYPVTTKYFTVTCVATDKTYTLTATGSDRMAGFVYTIDDAGSKATTGVPSGWTTRTDCWALKKDGSC